MEEWLKRLEKDFIYFTKCIEYSMAVWEVIAESRPSTPYSCNDEYLKVIKHVS